MRNPLAVILFALVFCATSTLSVRAQDEEEPSTPAAESGEEFQVRPLDSGEEESDDEEDAEEDAEEAEEPAETPPPPPPKKKVEPAPKPAPAAKPAPAPEPAPAALDAGEHALTKLRFYEKSFETASKDIYPSLLGHVEGLIREDREADTADGAQHLKAMIHEKQKEYVHAVVVMLKLIYEYPESKLAFGAKRKLMDLAGKKLKKQKARISEISRGPEAGLDRPARFAALLRALAPVDNKRLYEPLVTEFREFLGRYPAHADSGGITFLLAGLHARNGEDEAALLMHEESLALFKDKALLAKSQFAIGDIYAAGLKKYDKAAEAYETVVDKYADSDQAREAYMKLADLLYKKLKQPDNAVDILEKVTKLYPETDTAHEAFLLQAEIHKAKKRPAKAIAALEALAAMFPGERGVSALGKAAGIARSAKDYKEQVRLFEKLATDFPKSKEAPQALYDAGQAYENKLTDAEKAQEIYQKILDEYASSKLAKKAKKRIAALSK